jgi:hypothetical protein
MDAPEHIVQIAANYTCGHCDNDPVTLTQDELGVWHLNIPHDDNCPVRTGVVTAAADVARALSTPNTGTTP